MQIKALGQTFESEEAYFRHLECKERFERAEEYIKNVDNVGLLLGGLLFAIIAMSIFVLTINFFWGH